VNKNLDHMVAQEILKSVSKLKNLSQTLNRLERIEIGTSPRNAVLHHHGMTLFRYESEAPRQDPVPILLVYSLVNRPEIADLQPDRSLIKELGDAGYTVYLIDWGNPEKATINLNLEIYILEYLDAALQHMAYTTPSKSVHLVGLCQGGTFALCYASLYPEKIASLTTTATPIDFHTESDVLSKLVRYIDFDSMTELPEVLDGSILNLLFLFLKPYTLLQLKYVKLIENAQDKEYVANFLRMEKWIFDSPAISTRTCIEFADLFYKRNLLVREKLFLGGKLVRLGNINAPILNIFGRDDHLVPKESSQSLARLVSKNKYTEVEMTCGHVGVYVGKSSEKTAGMIIADWLQTVGT